MPKTSTLKAYHLTDRLKLTAVTDLFQEKPFRTSGNEIAYRFESNQYLIIYNFGSLVFFDVDSSKEAQVISILQQHVLPKEQIVSREEFALEEGPISVVEFRRVVLDSITFEKIQIIALVLAQSTALDYYENLVGTVLIKSGNYAELLEKEGRIRRRKATEVVKFIGFCLNTKQKVISSTSLLDSPDPTWEDAQLETLYKQMSEMFEIKERFRTLEYKLKTVQETLEILSDLTQSQRAMYLELTVIVLIAIEVVFYLFGHK